MRLFYLIFLMVFFSVAGLKAQSRLPVFSDAPAGPTVRFYPNPASSYITFEDYFKKYDKSYSIQVFNFLGKKVYEFELGDQKNIVSVSDFFSRHLHIPAQGCQREDSREREVSGK